MTVRKNIWFALRRWIFPPAQTKKRLVVLDVFRGIAILLVIGRHSPVSLSGVHVAVGLPLSVLHGIGWAGVDLFFVLSGFLIGGLIMKEIEATGNFAIGRFLLRRGFKIWPGYYALVLATFVIKRWIQGVSLHEVCYRLWPNMVHLQNYIREGPQFVRFGANYVSPIGHSWSLAVEEHFYLFLALLVFCILRYGSNSRRALRIIPFVGCALAGFCLCCRWYLQQLHPNASSMYWMFPTHLRMDGLFFGVSLAWFHCYHPRLWKWLGGYWALGIGIGAVLVVLVLATPIDAGFTRVAGFTLLYLGFGLCLIGCLHGAERSPVMLSIFSTRGAGIVAFIGFYSYSIYLWHIILGVYLVRFVTSALPHQYLRHTTLCCLGLTGLYVFAVIAAGVVLGRLVELPCVSIRDRILPLRSAQALPASPPAAHDDEPRACR